MSTLPHLRRNRRESETFLFFLNIKKIGKLCFNNIFEIKTSNVQY